MANNVNLYFSDGEKKALEKLAEGNGETVSQFIKKSVDLRIDNHAQYLAIEELKKEYGEIHGIPAKKVLRDEKFTTWMYNVGDVHGLARKIKEDLLK